MQVFVRAKICPDPCKRGLKIYIVFSVRFVSQALRTKNILAGV